MEDLAVVKGHLPPPRSSRNFHCFGALISLMILFDALGTAETTSRGFENGCLVQNSAVSRRGSPYAAYCTILHSPRRVIRRNVGWLDGSNERWGSQCLGGGKCAAVFHPPTMRRSKSIGKEDEVVAENAVSSTSERKALPSCFGRRQGPYLAILTETDACDTPGRMRQTYASIALAVSTGNVDLIVVRVGEPPEADSQNFQERVVELTKLLVSLRRPGDTIPRVVVNNNVEAAIEGEADGVHVKERDVDSIPAVRARLARERKVKLSATDRRGKETNTPEVIVGTSVHTFSSALHAYRMHRPNYLFVGTCYATPSHPEKNANELEGPEFPGRIQKAIEEEWERLRTIPMREEEEGETKAADDLPVVFAIGGIDEGNCHEPVCEYGANGVAAIRSVLQSSDPAGVVTYMKKTMTRRSPKRTLESLD